MTHAQAVSMSHRDSGGCFGRGIGAIISISIGIFILLVINVWHERLLFLTDDIVRWLPYANSAIVASMLGQIITVFLCGRVIKSAVETVSTIFSLISTIVLLDVFPFEFSGRSFILSFDTWAVVVLCALILGLSIGIIANFAGMIGSILKGEVF